MIWKQIIRFRWSLFPGTLFAAALLGLIAILLWQLADFSTEKTNWFSNLLDRDWQIVRFTTFQAGLSTLLSLAVGIVLAWCLHHQWAFPGRRILIALLSSALVIPTLVLVLGLVTVFGRNGWLNQITTSLFDFSFGSFLYGLAGILIAHVPVLMNGRVDQFQPVGAQTGDGAQLISLHKATVADHVGGKNGGKSLCHAHLPDQKHSRKRADSLRPGIVVWLRRSQLELEFGFHLGQGPPPNAVGITAELFRVLRPPQGPIVAAGVNRLRGRLRVS